MSIKSNILSLISTIESKKNRTVKLKIPKELTGMLLGVYKNIVDELEQETGAEITVFENDITGFVRISADEKQIREITVKIIDTITRVPRLGAVYEGTVAKVQPTGAMVEIMPGIIGLLPVFEISWDKTSSPLSEINEGDKIKVKLMDMDLKEGKFRLSRKVLLPDINNL